MNNKKIIKYSLLVALILAIQIKGQSLSEFLGHWTGTEELNSPSLTYENRNISLTIEEGGVREGFHIFSSSSDLIVIMEFISVTTVMLVLRLIDLLNL